MLEIKRKIDFFILVGLFTVYPVSSYALTAADAFVGYKVCCENSPRGIYSKDEFVYFVSETEMTDRVKRLVYEGRSMLNFQRQLKKYVVQGMVSIDESKISYGGALGTKIQKVIASHGHIDVNIKNIRSHILVNHVDYKKNNPKIYRYVAAIPVAEVNKYKKTVFENNNQIEAVVRKVFSEASEEERFQELIGYYLEMGLIEDAIYYQQQLLSKQLHLVNYYHQENPYHERKILREVLSIVKSGEKPPSIYLEQLPANAEVMEGVLEKHQKDPMELIVLLRTVLVDRNGIERNAVHKKIYESLSKLADKYSSMQDYLTLEGQIRKLEDDGSSFFQDSPLLMGVLETSGHLIISKNLSDGGTEDFRQAKELFHQGKNPEKIKNLLVRAIQLSPRHLKSWEYLAAILWAQKMEKEALLIYTQLYQMDNSNLEIMANLTECYERVGLKNIAMSYLEYIVMLNSEKNIRSVSDIVNRVSVKLD